MFVYKRNKKYYVYFSKNKRLSLEKIIKGERVADGRQPCMSWDSFINTVNQYLMTNRYNGNTIYAYNLNLNRLKEIVNLSPLNITQTDIERYKQARIKLVSPVTLNIELTKIQAAYNVMSKLGYCKPLKTVKVFQARKMPLSIKDFECEMIISEAKPIIKEFIIFALNTGLRLRELTNLNSDNFQDGFMLIFSKANFKVKRDKFRRVPINHKASEVMHTVISSDIKPDWLSHSFKKIVRKLKLNEQYNFHTLRKTFATNCVKRGMNIYDLAAILGHSDISITKIYYETDLTNAARILADM